MDVHAFPISCTYLFRVFCRTVVLAGVYGLTIPSMHAQSIWQQGGIPLGGFVYNVAMASNGTFFAVTDNGVAISTDNGTTWMFDSLLFDQNTYDVAADSENNVYFAADSGIYVFAINDSMLSLIGGLNENFTTIAIDKNGDIFAGSSTGGGLWEYPALGIWQQLGLQKRCSFISIGLVNTGAVWAGTTNRSLSSQHCRRVVGTALCG